MEQSRELTIHTDFEVSASLPSRISNVEWTVTFQCSNQWKWSEEAPHTWKIMYLGKSEFVFVTFHRVF